MHLHQLIIPPDATNQPFPSQHHSNPADYTSCAEPKPSFIMSYCALKAALMSVTEWLKHYCHWALQALHTISSENSLQSRLCTVWNLITMFLRVIDILWTLTGWCGVLQQFAATVSVLKMFSSITVRLYNYLLYWGDGRRFSCLWTIQNKISNDLMTRKEVAFRENSYCYVLSVLRKLFFVVDQCWASYLNWHC